MSTQQAEYAVRTVCELLGVSTSGYYAWRHRAPSARSQANVRLTQRIRAIHERSRQTYGVPRITAELREDGHRVGHNRVARLMKQGRLEGISRRKKGRTTRRNPDRRPAPDLVCRNFQASGVNQLWVGDLAYIRFNEEFLYLAVLLDAYSRRVIGWQLGTGLDHTLPLAALRMALAKRRVRPGLVHHSDRGVQYASQAYTQLLTQHQIRISMSRKGNPYDKARCESFFRTLKGEEVDRSEYRGLADAQARIGDFLERIYNQRRLHSALGYRPPVEFERQLRRGAGAVEVGA